MSPGSLQLAQDARRARGDQALALALDGFINQLNTHLSEADKVGPAARKKLMPILKKYAKSAHPFRTCVKDQLGEGLALKLANARCAVLKDIIEGTTKWRGKKTPSTPLPQYLSEPEPISCEVFSLDEETATALDHLGEAIEAHNFEQLSADVELDEEKLAQLTSKSRKKLPTKVFALPEKRAYPIHTPAHAQSALARVAQHGTEEEKKRVKAAVRRRYPNMPHTQQKAAA